MHEYMNNHGYRAILNASLLSGIGDSLYNIVFIIYAATMPFKSLAVTLAAMATSLPTMLSMITGSLADRTQAKPPPYGSCADRADVAFLWSGRDDRVACKPTVILGVAYHQHLVRYVGAIW